MPYIKFVKMSASYGHNSKNWNFIMILESKRRATQWIANFVKRTLVLKTNPSLLGKKLTLPEILL